MSAELQLAPAALPTVALAVRMARDMTPGAAPRSAARDRVRGLALDVVTARLQMSAEPAAGAWAPFVLALEIDTGWHINANPASSELLVPTTVAGDVRSLVYPRGRQMRFDFADEEVTVYVGQTAIRGEVAAEAGSVTLTYQACDERRCLPPVSQELSLPRNVRPGPQ